MKGKCKNEIQNLCEHLHESNCGVVLLDSNGTAIYSNKKANELFRLNSIKGLNIQTFHGGASSDEGAAILIRDMFQRKKASGRGIMHLLDGTPLEIFYCYSITNGKVFITMTKLPECERFSLRFPSLTKTELQVISLLMNGRTSKEAAEIMRLSSRTIDKHRQNIRQKISAPKKIHLSRFLLEL